MCAMSVCISNFLFLLSSNSPPFPPPILRNAAVTIDLVFRETNEQQKCFDWSGNAMPVRAGFSWRGNRFAMKNATQLTVEDGVKVSVYKNRQMDLGFALFPRHFKRRNAHRWLPEWEFVFVDKSSNHRSCKFVFENRSPWKK